MTDVRISQEPVEVLAASTPPAVRVSQVPVEVLLGAASTTEVWLSQVPLEVLLALTPAPLDPATRTIYVPWLEWLLDGGTVYTGPLGRPVDDPGTYYGGWKSDDVLSFGTVTRARSDEQGQYQAPTFAVTLNDPLGTYRARLATETVKGRIGRVRLIDHARRARLQTPDMVARGLAQSPKATRSRTLQVPFDDPVSREFGGSGFAPQIPRRRISRHIFSGLAANHEALNRPVPIIYGDFSEPVNNLGPIPCIPLDTEYLTGMTMPDAYWGRLLVCGHACKSINRMWIGEDEKEITGPSANVIFAVPGQYEWVNSSNPLLQGHMVRELGGEYFTIIYIQAGRHEWKNMRDGHIQMTVCCQGIEDSAGGDGTGTLITSVHAQLEHLLTNYVLGDQRTVPLAVPTWPDGDRQLDTDSFATVQTKAEARLAGGYPAAAYLGEAYRPSDLIAAFCRCGDVTNGWTRDWCFGVTMFDKSDEPVATFGPSGADLVLTESVEIVPDDSRHWNQIQYRFGERYIDRDWQVDNAHVRSNVSIAAYGVTLASPNFDLPFLRDAAVAQNIAEQLLRRHAHPPNRVTQDTDLVGFTLDLGQVIALTDKGGPTGSGWTARQLVVDAIAFDLDAFKTALVLLDHDQVPASLPITTAVSSLTSAAGVATVTTGSAHGYTTGEVITIAGAGQAEYNGSHIITVTSPTAFTYPITGAPASPATGTITAGTNDLGQVTTHEDVVKVKDPRTKTGPKTHDTYPHDLGGDRVTPITATTFAEHPNAKAILIDRAKLGTKPLKMIFWVKTTNTGTGVRLRVVHVATGTVVAQMVAIYSGTTNWHVEEVEVTRADFQSGYEEYILEGRRTNTTNDVFGYARMEPGPANDE